MDLGQFSSILTNKTELAIGPNIGYNKIDDRPTTRCKVKTNIVLV